MDWNRLRKEDIEKHFNWPFRCLPDKDLEHLSFLVYDCWSSIGGCIKRLAFLGEKEYTVEASKAAHSFLQHYQSENGYKLIYGDRELEFSVRQAEFMQKYLRKGELPNDFDSKKIHTLNINGTFGDGNFNEYLSSYFEGLRFIDDYETGRTPSYFYLLSAFEDIHHQEGDLGWKSRFQNLADGEPIEIWFGNKPTININLPSHIIEAAKRVVEVPQHYINREVNPKFVEFIRKRNEVEKQITNELIRQTLLDRLV